jgi:hypothetical protein
MAEPAALEFLKSYGKAPVGERAEASGRDHGAAA